ncbi:hypothetical protein GCM10011503_25240 [Henriciella pelagia]|uniref:Uncharacterized protein n=1 Tax=Henriciella pelagia TaxID=1977912 RepID=A0ABQ1JRL9_9PROT|nr:hypothetical protein GCM10011503_25240 [Henriciella pelagia]
MAFFGTVEAGSNSVVEPVGIGDMVVGRKDQEIVVRPVHERGGDHGGGGIAPERLQQETRFRQVFAKHPFVAFCPDGKQRSE